MIIAGPALRKTTPSAINIWLCLDAMPFSLDVTLKPASHPGINSIANTQYKYMKLGENVVVALVTLTPQNGSFPNIKLYYDILLDENNLQQQGLISNENDSMQGINLAGEPLPSVFIPHQHKNILYGSCRKPHAGSGRNNQFDQFIAIEKGLAEHKNNLDLRPSMLCLTGDQLYADDVAMPLLCGIEKMAKQLFGAPEKLPKKTAGGRLVDTTKIKYGARKRVLKNHGFTSGHADNHLMTLDEFVCMYLAIMGGKSLEMPSYDEVKDKMKIDTKSRSNNRRIKYRTTVISRDEYSLQRVRVSKFCESAKIYRRVLANVPTYMLFDDHEVSDDWNLTAENQSLLRQNPLSTRIQANALTAYLAFQGWGNDPEGIDNHLLNQLHRLRGYSQDEELKEIEHSLITRDYSFSVDGYPFLLAVDTRTQRDNSGTVPALLNNDAFLRLEHKVDLISANYADNANSQSLLLLSPAPVLGFKAIELFQFLARKMPRFSDNETWIGQRAAYNRLVATIQKLPFKSCCVLSGDVHYGFVRHLQTKNALDQDMSLFQLTSSSLHNSPSGVARLGLDTLSHAEQAIFRRSDTSYLHPMENDNEIINGHTNFGWLSLENAQPIKNTLHFAQASDSQHYEWEEYDWTYSLSD